MPGITNPAEAYFKDGTWGWDGSVWRKLPLLFGYSERWVQNLYAVKIGAGLFTTNSTAVPAGYIYVLQAASIFNDTGARGYARIFLRDTDEYAVLAFTAEPVQFEAVCASGAWVLEEGDKVFFSQDACLNNDALYVAVWGYKMKIAE